MEQLNTKTEKRGMNSQEIEAIAAKVPLFSCLSGMDRSAICRILVHKKFSKGETIVHEEDDEGQTFFVIVSGRVHVAVITSEGKKSILATLKPGDFFGEMAILDGEPRSASVIASEDCTLLMLYRKMFLDILQRYPKITIQILVEMSRRIRRANKHINTLSLMSVYGRVADVLLQLAKDQGQRVRGMIVIPNRPTHQVIADMAGTSRETVSRILSQLQKKHYIVIDGKKLVVLNEEKLFD
jgi:CRP/FNR family transcriptional regulator/CRP/FNR family cyclic AMP-dependent transcriptional regulator